MSLINACDYTQVKHKLISIPTDIKLVLEKPVRNKHPSLLDPFIDYEEIKVLWIGFSSLVLYLRVRRELTQMKHLSDAPLQGKLISLPIDIRLFVEKPVRNKHYSLFAPFIS